jgi:hypothetical protein
MTTSRGLVAIENYECLAQRRLALVRRRGRGLVDDQLGGPDCPPGPVPRGPAALDLIDRPLRREPPLLFVRLRDRRQRRVCVQDDQAVVEDDDRQPAGDRKVVIGSGLEGANREDVARCEDGRRRRSTARPRSRSASCWWSRAPQASEPIRRRTGASTCASSSAVKSHVCAPPTQCRANRRCEA